MPRHPRSVSDRFAALSEAVTHWTGSSGAFAAALGIIVVWGLLGPVFGYSDTWQLVINTGTTVVTFLMVFLIQRTQNKDALALHLKLNELVAIPLEPPLRRQLSLVYPQEKFRSKLLQSFLDFLEQSPMIKNFTLAKVK